MTSHTDFKIFIASNFTGDSIQNVIQPDGSISNVNYRFRLPRAIVLSNTDPHRITLAVESASIPLSFYAINNTNNKFNLKIGLTQYNNLTISQGNYRISQLIDRLNSILTQQSITSFTFSFDVITSKIAVNSTVGELDLVFEDSVGTNTSAVLGYTSSPDTLPPPITVIIDDVTITQYEYEDVVNLVYTSGVTINIDNLSTDNVKTGGGRSLLRIPVTSPPNTILQHHSNQPFETVITERHLTELVISLRDDDNKLLKINGNHPFFIVLRLGFQVTDSVVVKESRLTTQRRLLLEEENKGE